MHGLDGARPGRSNRIGYTSPAALPRAGTGTAAGTRAGGGNHCVRWARRSNAAKRDPGRSVRARTRSGASPNVLGNGGMPGLRRLPALVAEHACLIDGCNGSVGTGCSHACMLRPTYRLPERGRRRGAELGAEPRSLQQGRRGGGLRDRGGGLRDRGGGLRDRGGGLLDSRDSGKTAGRAPRAARRPVFPTESLARKHLHASLEIERLAHSGRPQTPPGLSHTFPDSSGVCGHQLRMSDSFRHTRPVLLHTLFPGLARMGASGQPRRVHFPSEPLLHNSWRRHPERPDPGSLFLQTPGPRLFPQTPSRQFHFQNPLLYVRRRVEPPRRRRRLPERVPRAEPRGDGLLYRRGELA
eukprot:gene17031-biopygen11503